MKYLLDTSIIVQSLYDNNKYLDYNKKFEFTNKNVFISSISKGELYALALLRKWDNQKLKKLEQFFQRMRFIDIIFYEKELFDIYAKIDVFSRVLKENGKDTGIGKNDLWIASCAIISNCDLLTSDKDFTHLNNHFLQVHYLP